MGQSCNPQCAVTLWPEGTARSPFRPIAEPSQDLVRVGENSLMRNIYDRLSAVIADHWKANENKYPQRIVLTPAQFEELSKLRRLGRMALNDDSPVSGTKFLGVPLVQDPSTLGLLLAHDGTEISIT